MYLEKFIIKRFSSIYELDLNLNNEVLLISVNLIHEHIHKHGNEEHRNFRSHYGFHKH